jgi:uncharacterized alkaline shock family protein YloU
MGGWPCRRRFLFSLALFGRENKILLRKSRKSMEDQRLMTAYDGGNQEGHSQTTRDQKESFGRIEVAPEVLTTIARFAALGVDGVSRMATVPADVARFFRRPTRHDGVILDHADGKLHFDIYVLMNPQVNVLEASRTIQAAVVEAIDKMVGLPVDAVNVHVEDVVYLQGEAA